MDTESYQYISWSFSVQKFACTGYGEEDIIVAINTTPSLEIISRLPYSTPEHSIPEPSSFLLASITILAFLLRRR